MVNSIKKFLHHLLSAMMHFYSATHKLNLNCILACSSSLITQGPTNVTKTYSSSTAAREDVTLQCEFDGSQNISILWFFSSNQLSTTSDYMITNYANRSVLTIFNATISDIGSYICNASNDATSEAKSAYIHVTGMLKLFVKNY